MTPTIAVRGVSKTFLAGGRAATALADVSFEVLPGSFTALVGPSGCGKSTLLGLTAGLVDPTTGRIEIEGREVRGVDARIGYLFQKDALLPWRTVRDNVALPLVFRRVPRDEARRRAEEWIGRVGLSDVAVRHPHQLSGGMRKRVSLATTMVYDPRIVLMDEPFAALDVQTRNLLENDLLEIWAATAKTILFVTHDLEEAIALADRVIVLSASPGRVKAIYEVTLPRPRLVTEIRFDPAFAALYERIWTDLRDEVLAAFGR